MIPLNGYLTIDPCHLYKLTALWRHKFNDTLFHFKNLTWVEFSKSISGFHVPVTTLLVKTYDKTFAIEVNDFGISTCFALKHIQMLICTLSNTYNHSLLR